MMVRILISCHPKNEQAVQVAPHFRGSQLALEHAEQHVGNVVQKFHISQKARGGNVAQHSERTEHKARKATVRCLLVGSGPNVRNAILLEIHFWRERVQCS